MSVDDLGKIHHKIGLIPFFFLYGPEWWKKNSSTSAVHADEFLRSTDDSEEARYDHQDRIIKLGHMLYALKDRNGYEAFIGSLKTRKLAPTFFELWVANILKENCYGSRIRRS
jgi:hypothetical protein